MDLRARKSGLRTEWKRKCRPAARYSFAFIMVRVYICIYTGYIARRNRGVSIPRRVGMHHRRQSRRNTTVPIECMQIIKDIVRRLIKQTRYRPYVSRESIFSFFFFFSNRQNSLQLDQFYYYDAIWIQLSEKQSLFYVWFYRIKFWKYYSYNFIMYKNNPETNNRSTQSALTNQISSYLSNVQAIPVSFRYNYIFLILYPRSLRVLRISSLPPSPSLEKKLHESASYDLPRNLLLAHSEVW